MTEQRNAEAVFNQENLWVIGVILYGHPSDHRHVALLELFSSGGTTDQPGPGAEQGHAVIRHVKDRDEALAILRSRGWKIQEE